jgi:predicted dehydrogenase
MAVRIGVKGCGKWGRDHVRVYSELDCKPVALSDKKPEVEELAKKFGAKKVAEFKS